MPRFYFLFLLAPLLLSACSGEQAQDGQVQKPAPGLPDLG